MSVGVAMAESGKKGRTPEKGVSAKLYKVHAKKLAELARAEDLDGGSAAAFDKHFGKMLDNLLIQATAARLKRLQQEKDSRE